ncbi:MAG: hypothetical protein ACR2HS_00010 [Gammaproteobacteria bacterium]
MTNLQKKGEICRFTITGRNPPSVLQKGNTDPHGDHVTAYHLIKEGLNRIFNAIPYEALYELTKYNNRKFLRERREKIYNYISTISVIDNNEARKKGFYKACDKVVRNYLDNKQPKQNIREVFKQRKFSEVKQQYESNRDYLLEMFKKLSAIVLTFYNKIENSSFYKIKDHEAKPTEGAEVKKSVNGMTAIGAWLNDLDMSDYVHTTIITAKRQSIINYMLSLIHYPEITPQSLKEHLREYKDLAGTKSKPRNNNLETLSTMLARHIHIFFSVYS